MDANVKLRCSDPHPATLCRERSEGAAGRKMKNGMHLRREGLTSSFLLDHELFVVLLKSLDLYASILVNAIVTESR